MKLRKKYISAMVFAFVLVFFTAAAMATVAEETVTGTVIETDAGLTIAAVDGQYLVSGYDMSEMVGKTVKATGAVTEEEGVKTINVISVEVLE